MEPNKRHDHSALALALATKDKGQQDNLDAEDGQDDPSCRVADDRLPIQARVLLGILKGRLCGKPYCWPGQKLLAEQIGISEGRIRVWIKFLADAGLIEIQRTQSTNRYWIPPRSRPLENERCSL